MVQALLQRFLRVVVALEAAVAVEVQVLLLTALPYKPELYQQMRHKEAVLAYPHQCNDKFQTPLGVQLGLAVLGLAVGRLEDIEY
jgi:hypothetical protein